MSAWWRWIVVLLAIAGATVAPAMAGAKTIVTGGTQHGTDMVLVPGQPGFSVSGTAAGTLGAGSFYGLGLQTGSTSFALTTTTTFPDGTLTQSGAGTNTGPNTATVALTITGGTGLYAHATGSSTLYSTSGPGGPSGTPFSSASLGTITLTPSSRFTWAGPVLIAPAMNGNNYTGLLQVSCPNPGFCAVAGAFGDVVTSSDPRGGVWMPLYGLDPDGIITMGCATARLCVAGDDEGRLLTSTNLAAGRSGWSAPALIDPPTGALNYAHGLTALTCPSSSLCVVGDQFGGILTSTNPAVGGGTWSPYVRVDPSNDASGLAQINGLSCPSTRLCVGVDQQGNLLWSRDPTGGASAWHVASLESGTSLNAVSCASPWLCVAVGDHGRAFVSSDPTGGAGAWHAVVLSGSGSPLQGVGCSPGRGWFREQTRCVVVDRAGYAYTTRRPLEAAGAWRSDFIYPQGNLVSAACVTTSFCVAIANYGDAIVGAR